MKRKTVETLFFVILFASLCALGFWQISRLSYKNGIIETVEKRLSMPAITLQEALQKINSSNIDDYDFRKVLVNSTPRDDFELHSVGKYYKGKLGLHVFSTIKDGKTNVLINRGWIPEQIKKHSKRRQKISNKVIEHAVIRKSQQPSWFTPENDPEQNYWFWIDANAMSQHLASTQSIQVNSNLYLVAISKDTSGLPKPANTRPVFRNDHLQYAITWFTLALILLLMSIYYRRKNG